MLSLTLGKIRAASSWDELLALIDDANYILIEDTGNGMSLKGPGGGLSHYRDPLPA